MGCKTEEFPGHFFTRAILQCLILRVGEAKILKYLTVVKIRGEVCKVTEHERAQSSSIKTDILDFR